MNFRKAPSGIAKRGGVVVDITALVDVVFQLLIFFLLTSSYVAQTQPNQDSAKVPVELPESSLEATSQDVENLKISINSDGEVFLEENRVTIEELGIELLRAAEKNPKTIVLIRGDETVPYGRIAQVMAIARASRLRISAELEGR